MSYLWHTFLSIPAPSAALLAIVFATAGWLYTARRARNLSRKQHTFNALLQSAMNDKHHSQLDIIRPFVRANKLPDFSLADQDKAIAAVREALRFILNHYEFIAAGIRNGDISERLLRDTERGTVLTLFEASHKYIAMQRDALRRSTYEHIEWLYIRWKENPPTRWQRLVERAMARPLYRDEHKWIALAVLVGCLVFVIVGYLHIPGELFNR